MSEELRKLVIDEFSIWPAQKFYIEKAKEGLWGSEFLLIKKYFKQKSSVLDIGCGTGRTTIPLFNLGYKVLGIDITPKMIENAKKIAKTKKLGIKYEVGDATKLEYKDSSFSNALFSYNGWSQIPGKENRLKALKEVYRILGPNGHFIFTSHTRVMKGFSAFWIKQWIKFYILKPLGFPVYEVDFGDRFFQRGEIEFRKQFIHIPSAKEVTAQINEAGFELILIEKSNIISTDNNPSPPVTFYVCKKAKK